MDSSHRMNTRSVSIWVFADLIQIAVFAPPEPIPVELATGERVEILNLLLITPADEVAETVFMPFQRCLRELVLLVCKVQFKCSFCVDWFETHGWSSPFKRTP